MRVPPATPGYAWYIDYWGTYRFFRFGHVFDLVPVTHLYLALPLFLFALPTLLMGFAFPVLQRAVHDELRTSGRKVGALQAANIAGCVAGSLLVGLVALQWLGTAETLRLLALAGLVFAAVGIRYEGKRFAFAALALVLLAAALPGREELWRRLHGQTERSSARSSTRTRPASSRLRRATASATGCRSTARATPGCPSAASTRCSVRCPLWCTPPRAR